jgi:hypothetical protein
MTCLCAEREGCCVGVRRACCPAVRLSHTNSAFVLTNFEGEIYDTVITMTRILRRCEPSPPLSLFRSQDKRTIDTAAIIHFSVMVSRGASVRSRDTRNSAVAALSPPPIADNGALVFPSNVTPDSSDPSPTVISTSSSTAHTTPTHKYPFNKRKTVDNWGKSQRNQHHLLHPSTASQCTPLIRRRVLGECQPQPCTISGLP